MPKFSRKSKAKLDTCHEDLQALFEAVVVHFDCTPIYGHRTPEEQASLYAIGRTTEKHRKPVTYKDGTKKKSMHNHSPSLAIDIAPYPIDFDDINRIRYFAGFVMGTAAAMGIDLKWGGDWDQDTETADNTFEDLLHYELVGVLP